MSDISIDVIKFTTLYTKDKVISILKLLYDRQDEYFNEWKQEDYDKNKNVVTTTWYGRKSEKTLSYEYYFLDFNVQCKTAVKKYEYNSIKNRIYKLIALFDNIYSTVNITKELILDNKDYEIVKTMILEYNNG